MADKSQKERNIRKLGKIGPKKSQSYYITIPIELIKKLGWKDNQNLVVRKYRGKNKLVIEDHR